MSVRRPPRFTPRRDAGLYGFERALEHGGFDLVAGVDEAGRGACAGPLVVAAVVLRPGRRGEIEGLADSKLLTPRRREEIYAQIVARALAWSAVVISCQDIDRIGLHRCNVAGMRRAVTRLETRPAYVLSDGFRVPGLDVPALAVTKGDRVAACVAAASVIAKVTRDRLMVALHDRFPAYGFDVHKGYITPDHSAALAAHGPCQDHRFSFVNVARLNGTPAPGTSDAPLPEATISETGVPESEMPEIDASGAGALEAGMPEADMAEAGVPEGWMPAGWTPGDGRRAPEAGMKDNESGAAGRTGGCGAALEGVAEQAGVV
jgi:ribonuclease HII